jgi:RNA polymerase sigma-70 factor (ECF subfamily)
MQFRNKKSDAAVVDLGANLEPEERSFYQNIFKKHHLPLYRFVRGLGVGQSDALDIVQDVYLRIVRQNQPQKLAVTPRAYLYRIAINLLRDQLRRLRLHEELLHVVQPQATAPSLAVTPEAALEQKQNIQALKIAIRNLTPEERRVLILHRFHDLTCEEISQQTGLPKRTVERRLSSALSSCRAYVWRSR